MHGETLQETKVTAPVRRSIAVMVPVYLAPVAVFLVLAGSFLFQPERPDHAVKQCATPMECTDLRAGAVQLLLVIGVPLLIVGLAAALGGLAFMVRRTRSAILVGAVSAFVGWAAAVLAAFVAALSLAGYTTLTRG